METIALKVLLQVVEVFDKLNIPYVVGGSIASSLHSVSRTTNDADVVAMISEQQASDLMAEFEKDFYIGEEMIRRAVRQQSSFNMIHFDTTFKVDVFVAKSPFQRNEIERRQLFKLGENQQYAAYFSTPEDIILAKLDWYRKGSYVSEQQRRDIANVIRIQGNRLDFDYLNHWASELGLSDLLKQMLEESLGE